MGDLREAMIALQCIDDEPLEYEEWAEGKPSVFPLRFGGPVRVQPDRVFYYIIPQPICQEEKLYKNQQ
jgi:hypothetical protein